MRIIEKTFETKGNMDQRTKTTRIILHHADASKCSVEDIDKCHKENGWCKIGYHFFIDKKGNIFRGREENAVGAHAYGSNYDSIGICAEGKYMEENMPVVQRKAFTELIKYLMAKYNINVVQCHRDVNNTNCPGKNFPFDEIMQNITAKNEIDNKKIAEIQQSVNKKYNTNIKVDNIYGNETRKALIKGLQVELNSQFGSNIVVDGMFGNETKNACATVQKGATGNITYLIQAMLVCKGYDIETDGIFGSSTLNAVKDLQKKNGLNVDGIVGKETFTKLFS